MIEAIGLYEMVLSAVFCVVIALHVPVPAGSVLRVRVRVVLEPDPWKNWKEGLGDRLGWKCTEWHGISGVGRCWEIGGR